MKETEKELGKEFSDSQSPTFSDRDGMMKRKREKLIIERRSRSKKDGKVIRAAAEMQPKRSKGERESKQLN